MWDRGNNNTLYQYDTAIRHSLHCKNRTVHTVTHIITKPEILKQTRNGALYYIFHALEMESL
jgi:hypothetical protein